MTTTVPQLKWGEVGRVWREVARREAEKGSVLKTQPLHLVCVCEDHTRLMSTHTHFQLPTSPTPPPLVNITPLIRPCLLTTRYGWGPRPCMGR